MLTSALDTYTSFEDRASVAEGDVDEDDEAAVPPRPPTTAENFGAFDTLRQALYHDDVAEADINLHRQVDGLEGLLANAKASRRSQQTTLDTFLS